MKNKSLFEIMIFETSWYIGIIFGIIVYVASFLVKNMNTGLIPLGPAFSTILKIFSILFFIGGILSGIRSLINKVLLKNTKSLDDIKKLSWKEFENLIEAYYNQKGYEVIHTGYDSSDGGIDLIAKKNGEKIIIQCKHWKAYKIDVKVIREVYGLLVAENASKAIIVTSGDFTEPAKEFAKEKPIELIDGNKLTFIISEINKFNTQLQNKNIKKENKSPILCPQCNSPMVLRIAKHGEHAGKKFWGCSNYPKCKNIISLE